MTNVSSSPGEIPTKVRDPAAVRTWVQMQEDVQQRLCLPAM